MKNKTFFILTNLIVFFINTNCVVAQEPAGCSGGCVYPGDVDNNGIVNMHDLLPIGVAYGATGLLRDSVNTNVNFIGTTAAYWGQTFAGTAFDYRYVDCTGNGIINAADAFVVQNNYGLTHPLNGNSLFIPSVEGSYNLYLDLDLPDTTLVLGDTVSIAVRLGNPTDNYNVYGLAFSLQFNAEDANTFEINFPQSFINNDTNIVAIYRRISNTQIDVGITRINQQAALGNGIISRIKFVMEDIIDSGKNKTSALNSLQCSINNIQILTNGLVLQQIENVTANTIDQAVDIPAKITTVPNPNNDVRIYPNPATNVMQITTPNNIAINTLQVFNLNGQSIYQKQLPQNSNTATLDVQDLPNGWYVLQLVTNAKVINQAFIVAH